MSIRPFVLVSALVAGWLVSCAKPGATPMPASGEVSPAPAAAPAANPPAANPIPTAVSQDPSPGKTLLETLLEQRKDEPVFLCDSDERTEFPSVNAFRAPLREKGIPFDSPSKWHYQNHQYYLNKLIPMLRRAGKVWLVLDHRSPALMGTFRKFLLDHHKIAFRQEFADATLLLLTNEFNDAARRIDLKTVTSGSSMVTGVAFVPDGSLVLVSGKSGDVRFQQVPKGAQGQALKLPTAGKGKAGVFTGGEAGLIGIAVHPKFPAEPKVYLHYTWQAEDGSRRAYVSVWRADLSGLPKALSLVDEQKLLEVPMVADNHNAGCLQFGPDGYLYIGIGDGEEGQWTIGRSPSHTLRGKLLRIDVDHTGDGKPYAVPADNPFVGQAGFPPETWAWGFRNPWRFAFVPDGRIVVGDIGEDVNEELTFAVRGKHHGWPYQEGLNQRNKLDKPLDLQPPLLPYGRESGMSVIAGQVYEGQAFPELRGKYVFCDHLSGYIWAIDLPDTATTLEIGQAQLLARWPLLLTHIEKGKDGELYFGAHTGEVLQMVPPTGAAIAEAPPAPPADPAMARGLFGALYSGPAAPPATPAQVALGARLFGEPGWSADGARSCATCHDPGKHGQDGKPTPAGERRNTPSAWNASRQFAQFRDYRVETVEQAAVASLGSHLGHAAPAAAVQKLSGLGDYPAAFAAAYPGSTPAVSEANVGHALGAYLRSLTTRSRWDAFLDGDDQALTEAERVGLGTFVQVGCMSCHQYRGLGGGMPQKLGLMKAWTGADPGRAGVDPTPGLQHFFKVPALYNVAETGPWYHDGSMATLGAAVQHMAEVQLGRTLTKGQVEAIVTFLGALTGTRP